MKINELIITRDQWPYAGTSFMLTSPGCVHASLNPCDRQHFELLSPLIFELPF